MKLSYIINTPKKNHSVGSNLTHWHDYYLFGKLFKC